PTGELADAPAAREVRDAPAAGELPDAPATIAPGSA
ncbi:MAG: hypothetical protein JWO23_657, partial [Solirubrobacterales bacterium]|nr:hypothetical protein [Solirubrobacterales bacterium]